MSYNADHAADLRSVELSAGKTLRRDRPPHSVRGGIVAERSPGFVKPAPLKVRTADSLFPPIIAGPISVSNGGGAIATGLPVQLIFWGNAWSQPATTPSAGAVVAAVQNILRGPWMAGLRQYGIRRSSFGGATVVTTPGPPGTYQDSDVEDLIWALIDDDKFPEPDDPGGRNLYMVFMPPGTTYGPGGIFGKHLDATDFDLPFDTDHAWVGFICTNPALSRLTSTFCHELAEMCTDPESDAWTVTGNQEIGDVCNLIDQVLNGVTVEAYWSAEDNACLIPTAYSVRRALKWSGHTLGGQGLLSVQTPIPSLNALVVSL
jgi:hypothetical protein